MDGGAWWATVHRVAKSWTQLRASLSLTFLPEIANISCLHFVVLGRTVVGELLVVGEGAPRCGRQLPPDPVLVGVAGPLDRGHLASHDSPVRGSLVAVKLHQSK